jgi:hypothetical protein
MSHETVPEKATRLKKNFRVIQVTERAFMVIGDHSTYEVRRFNGGCTATAAGPNSTAPSSPARTSGPPSKRCSTRPAKR